MNNVGVSVGLVVGLVAMPFLFKALDSGKRWRVVVVFLVSAGITIVATVGLVMWLQRLASEAAP